MGQEIFGRQFKRGGQVTQVEDIEPALSQLQLVYVGMGPTKPLREFPLRQSMRTASRR